jgi:hypothetical protein
MSVTFTEDNIRELQHRLEDAAIKCSERCLYQSAKWLTVPVLIWLDYTDNGF